ncbi:uncharacterized protein LOC116431696 [Nomia melanderi]|uniref:uncharacterized protein LOC116431696 n=1 Tax=Nomia melanderi TaxID=2448451 RepID=UPI001303F5E5|nr:uncharacterized protein LOC116431696 [Nomia melanderi]
MKWIVFCVTLIIWNCMMLCQDIIFPNEEEIPPISNKGPITERVPIVAPGQCPENMLLYPGYGNRSTWICDCKPRFLYFPLNNSCHEAYRQGPCPPQNYVVLFKNESVPKCVENPCIEDGLVKYNNVCYPLRAIGGPCGSDVLSVNETTFELECEPANIVPFIIIDAPKRQCPTGTRRNSLGICRDVI